MLKIWRNADKYARDGLKTLLFVFAVGFCLSVYPIIASLASGSTRYTPLSLAIFCLAGFVFINGAFQGVINEGRLSNRRFLPLFFGLLTLISLMQYIAIDAFFLWLLALPLSGEIEERYSSFPVQLALYAMILASLVLPVLGRTGATLSSLLPFILSISAALMFVVVFSRIQRRERDNRVTAELLAAKLEVANQKLASFAMQAEELATTKERNRIAREIHDNLGHYLTVVNVQLEASKMLLDKKPEKAREAVGKAQQMTQEGLQAIRQSIGALRVSAVENRPITDAITDLTNSNSAAGIATTYTVIGQPHELSEKTKLTLYRVVQEGLTNSRKHSQAEAVDVELDYSSRDSVRVTIKDNGVGTEQTDSGFGLLGIRERINLLGGSLDIETAPGLGFRLTTILPNVDKKTGRQGE